jgi:hypothetical protein
MPAKGDTVAVWKLDRLGRNTLHILQTVKALTDRGVTLISATAGIDSSTPAGRLVIGVLASMSEFERELVKERTALKRAMSRANCIRSVRRNKVADPNHIATVRRMKADGHTRGTSPSTSGSAAPPFTGTWPTKPLSVPSEGAPTGCSTDKTNLRRRVSIYGRRCCRLVAQPRMQAMNG